MMSLVEGDKHLPNVDFLRWYQGEDRHYHNLRHIQECLILFRQVKPLLIDPQSVWMAIWFHDCVYSTLPDPKNEELSAAEARKWIKDPDQKRVVTNLILVTKHSAGYPPMTTDECFMCDIDLAGLGFPPEIFDTYSENIRKEYSQYEDAVYYPGRLGIMMGFLTRAIEKRLYYTQFFKESFQDQALINLEREITNIKKQCGL